MSGIGTYPIDELLTFWANTHRFDTGAATDADSVPAYRVYEEITDTPLLTGSMALRDSANTAGFYSGQITLSAANGFENGKSYSIYISATVNSVTGTMHHTFQVGPSPADVTHWAGTAVATPTVNGVPEVDVTALNGSAPAAVRLASSATTIVPGTVDTAAFTPTTTAFEADDITEATADHFKGRTLIFTSNALIYQATSISTYALTGGRGHFTVIALTEAPTDGTTFVIV